MAEQTPFKRWTKRFGQNPWAEHPKYTHKEWQKAVFQDETRAGYHQWVLYHLLSLADGV